MSPHFVLDFDSTLFDTSALWNAWRNMLEELGYEEEQIREIADRLIPEGFTPREHALRLGVNGKTLETALASLNAFTQQTAPHLLYSDVVPFIQAHAPSTILTFGDSGYQLEKIHASGLHAHVDDIRMANSFRGKALQLGEMFQADAVTPLVFVDDSLGELEAVHASALPITLVRMKRPGQRRSLETHPLDHEAWRVIESLEELSFQPTVSRYES